MKKKNSKDDFDRKLSKDEMRQFAEMANQKLINGVISHSAVDAVCTGVKVEVQDPAPNGATGVRCNNTVCFADYFAPDTLGQVFRIITEFNQHNPNFKISIMCNNTPTVIMPLETNLCDFVNDVRDGDVNICLTVATIITGCLYSGVITFCREENFDKLTLYVPSVISELKDLIYPDL